ncbi:Aste57867_21018 [Aphanomyces stellatus]|uniref:Aste57867_21018 protein n=1 Tax=Aphanomyces stellatus TaxID=120398 RepID=A0A485LII8_9STRA|nr:hypothetical protein As57867_020950 [Aphanomyces stellatus]VFT97693.1 Aste57867_21018 [Aphanomyces stellatus]
MGDQLRSIHCNLDFLSLESIASGCVLDSTDNTIFVQADSAVVQLVLPFLKTLLLIVECVDFLADEGAANDLPLLPATLPSFDSLEKVIQALESIHNPVSSLSMELVALAGRLADGSNVDIPHLRQDFIQSIQEFTQSSATTTLIHDLFDAIAAEKNLQPPRLLFGFRKVAIDGTTWVCQTHSSSPTGSCNSNLLPLPGIWLLDAAIAHVPNGWQKSPQVLMDVVFQLRFQCEKHDQGSCKYAAKSFAILGGSSLMCTILPILRACALLLKGLTLASFYDLEMGNGFQFDFQNALRHVNFVEALDVLHKTTGPRLAFEPTLVALVDRLENEELVDNQAQNAMKVMRQMFLDLRASVTLADAISQIGLDATKSQLNDLQQLEHTSGKESALWVCNFHAMEVAP